MNSYAEACSPRQGVEVLERWIPRARLGLHIRLDAIASRVVAAFRGRDAEGAALAVGEYLAEVGCGDLDGGRAIVAFYAATAINTWQWELAFMRQGEPPQQTEPPAYEFSDRRWAWIVHKLAASYGWSRDQIFDLYPEEAAVYLQEILVDEYHQREYERSLSELSYKYDKGSKKSHFQPTPKPAWMESAPKRQKVRIPRRFVPPHGVRDMEDIAH